VNVIKIIKFLKFFFQFGITLFLNLLICFLRIVVKLVKIIKLLKFFFQFGFIFFFYYSDCF